MVTVSSVKYSYNYFMSIACRMTQARISYWRFPTTKYNQIEIHDSRHLFADTMFLPID